MPRLTARLLRNAATLSGWARSGFDVLLAAHGSATGAAPEECTMAFANALARWLPARRIHVGFLEQDPHLAEVAGLCSLRTLHLPFFAGAGGHLTRDVPQALDGAGFEGLRMESLGEAYFIPDLIAHTLECAAQRTLAA
ncbi:CbiX/SirB N-terminal domain-containing protein [Roseibium salinum]|nr:CbiX/SirB N-terminal domain-containing protein [Roseibium salinum]